MRISHVFPFQHLKPVRRTPVPGPPFPTFTTLSDSRGARLSSFDCVVNRKTMTWTAPITIPLLPGNKTCATVISFQYRQPKTTPTSQAKLSGLVRRKGKESPPQADKRKEKKRQKLKKTNQLPFYFALFTKSKHPSPFPKTNPLLPSILLVPYPRQAFFASGSTQPPWKHFLVDNQCLPFCSRKSHIPYEFFHVARARLDECYVFRWFVFGYTPPKQQSSVLFCVFFLQRFRHQAEKSLPRRRRRRRNRRRSVVRNVAKKKQKSRFLSGIYISIIKKKK